MYWLVGPSSKAEQEHIGRTSTSGFDSPFSLTPTPGEKRKKKKS